MDKDTQVTRPGSPAWNALLSRAVMNLDDDALAAFRKRKSAMDRKFRRNMEENGLTKPPYDFYMVQEILVEYDRTGFFMDAVRRCNGSESECIEAKAWDADIKLVWEFVERRLKDRMRARAADIAQNAQEGLGRMVTDEGCKLNPKALELALERTVPELYGNPDRKDSGRFSTGGGIVYNLPNMSVTLISAPAGMAQSKVAERVAEAIEVQSEVV